MGVNKERIENINLVGKTSIAKVSDGRGGIQSWNRGSRFDPARQGIDVGTGGKSVKSGGTATANKNEADTTDASLLQNIPAGGLGSKGPKSLRASSDTKKRHKVVDKKDSEKKVDPGKKPAPQEKPKVKEQVKKPEQKKKP